MALPEHNQPWPPKDARPVLDNQAEWSAWYSGDPLQLESVYTAAEQKQRSNERPSQYAPGVRGVLARWWWGKPQTSNEPSSKLHVPLAADIASASADLLFSEPPVFVAAEDKLQVALDTFVDEGVHAQLHEAAEVCAALGGAYLRVVWDNTSSDAPWFDAIHADAAVPEFRWGKLHAVTFWQKLDTPHNDGGVWRALERHEEGRIFHGLYVGNTDYLGTPRPLAEHPATAHLAELVDDESGYDTGIDELTVQYVPNMLPNRRLRGSKQGRADIQGVEPLLDSLDEAYSSWRRDIRLGKARIMVPESMLETDGPGSTGRFDIDRELYVGLRMLDKGTGSDAITAQQFAIRYQEHAQTCKDWTAQIVRQAGYSTRTFGESGEVAATATEVKAQERRSYLTRGKKVRYWKPALRNALRVWVKLANAHYRANLPIGDGVDIEFPDGVYDDVATVAQTAVALRNAEAASTDTVVRMLHPDWDDKRVGDEVAAISTGGVQLGLPDDAGL